MKWGILKDEGAGTEQVEEGKRRFSSAEKQLLVGSVILITLFAFEALATTTVMPTVLQDLGNEAWLPLAAGAPLATQVLSSASAGPLTSAKGARLTLAAGVLLFSVGLLLAGGAVNIGMFIAGRAVQGIGAGLSIVPLYVLVGVISTDLNRRYFFAAFSMAWVLPALVGPPIAGLVVESFGWRPIFLAVPIMAFAAFLRLTSLLTSIKVKPSRLPTSFPVLLAYAAVTGFALLAAQFSSATGGAIGAIILTASLVVAFFSLGKLLPAGTLILRRGVPALVATRGLTIAAQVGAASLVPMVLQVVQGWSPAQASLAVGLGSLSWALGATLQARTNIERIKLPLIGASFLALGLGLLLSLAIPLKMWPIGLLGWAFAGFGIGFTHTTLSDLALGRVSLARHAEISSALQVADNSGPALALAFIAMAFVVTDALGNQPWIAAFVVTFVIALIGIAAAKRIE